MYFTHGIYINEDGQVVLFSLESSEKISEELEGINYKNHPSRQEKTFSRKQSKEIALRILEIQKEEK